MFDELVFGICWYDDASIYRLLSSLPREAKKIVVDGKFEYNPSENLLSQWEMREYIKSFPNVELIDAPNLPEPEKRNKYLENDYKYLFIIDSDEYIVTADWERFFKFVDNLKEGVHDIFFEVDEEGGIASYPRLWIYPKDYRYVLCHNIWTDRRRGIVYKSGNTDGVQIPAVLCGMNDSLRTEKYLSNVVEYQTKMMAFEKSYRQKYREGKLEDFI